MDRKQARLLGEVARRMAIVCRALAVEQKGGSYSKAGKRRNQFLKQAEKFDGLARVIRQEQQPAPRTGGGQR